MKKISIYVKNYRREVMKSGGQFIKFSNESTDMVIFQDTVNTEKLPTFQTVYEHTQPIAVAAWVCGRSLAVIAGSNPASSMDVCLFLMWCLVRHSSLCRTYHSTREVLPRVVCLSIIAKSR
jgi:hypothetical protein